MFNNFGDIFSKVNEFQSKMKDMKTQLARETVTAEAGGGMVKVTVNGNKELISLNIEKELINPVDSEMLQDLIVAAVNKGMNEAENLAKKRLEEISKNVIPGGLGGMDLSKFGL